MTTNRATSKSRKLGSSSYAASKSKIGGLAQLMASEAPREKPLRPLQPVAILTTLSDGGADAAWDPSLSPSPARVSASSRLPFRSRDAHGWTESPPQARRISSKLLNCIYKGPATIMFRCSWWSQLLEVTPSPTKPLSLTDTCSQVHKGTGWPGIPSEPVRTRYNQIAASYGVSRNFPDRWPSPP